MERKFEIAFNIFMFIFGVIIGAYFTFYFLYNENKDNNDKIIISDTIYNKVTLDSIEYNIIKRDSIIYNITNKYEDEIKQANNISDSCAVELFKELVQE